MPSIEQNEGHWSVYEWPDQGDEWSGAWGGTANEWWGTLFPRIMQFLPVPTILEIAPGHGRWTRYLLPHCERFIGIDLTERCIDACRQRFGKLDHAEFHVNDGRSLEVVPDGIVDFTFSFDSLVHAERDVLQAYVEQLALKLSPDGVAFIHHSNAQAFVDPTTGELPFDNPHWRAPSMSAELFDEFCTNAGLVCIGQELVNWLAEPLTDCFSMLTRPDAKFGRSRQFRENPSFMDEARNLAEISRLYGQAGFPAVAAAHAPTSEHSPPGQEAAGTAMPR